MVAICWFRTMAVSLLEMAMAAIPASVRITKTIRLTIVTLPSLLPRCLSKKCRSMFFPLKVQDRLNIPDSDPLGQRAGDIPLAPGGLADRHGDHDDGGGRWITGQFVIIFIQVGEAQFGDVIQEDFRRGVVVVLFLEKLGAAEVVFDAFIVACRDRAVVIQIGNEIDGGSGGFDKTAAGAAQGVQPGQPDILNHQIHGRANVLLGRCAGGFSGIGSAQSREDADHRRQDDGAHGHPHQEFNQGKPPVGPSDALVHSPSPATTEVNDTFRVP
ncbi:exported hypothetical protein [Desulfosarcina cetonica]|nr:exported hypothetical protein [Desulfosarcina cetonica]